MRGALGGALVIGTSGGILEGTAVNPAGAAGTPKRGGTLRAGISGGSSSDTMNALTPIQSTDFAEPSISSSS